MGNGPSGGIGSKPGRASHRTTSSRRLEGRAGSGDSLGGRDTPATFGTGAAASALGDLGKVQGIPALEHALEDKIPAVKTSAAISLGELGVKDSLMALRKALADPNPVVKAAVVSALLRFGEPFEAVGSELYELAQNNDPGSRSAAGKAVGRAHGANRKAAIEFLSGM